MKTIICSLAAAMMVAGAWGQSAMGQVIYNGSAVNPPGGISVSGTGDATAKPDALEIKLRISGTAELTDDAIVKFHNARERVQKAFEGLKIDKLKLDESNPIIRTAASKEAAQMAMRGMQQTSNAPTQIDVSSTMRVRLNGISEMPQEELIKTLGKLLDTAKDSGAGVGPSDEEISMAYRYGRVPTNSIVKFIVTNADHAREEAYRNAVDDAKKRAERLAKLYSLKLGGVTSIQETLVSGDSPNRSSQPWETVQDPDPPKPGEVTTENMSGAIFKVVLAVRFGIDSPDQTTTQAAAH